MNEPAHDLERLISRHLDDECSPDERRALNARLRRDPRAAGLFEEHRALDREVKHALRSAQRHWSDRHRPVPVWERAARAFVLAAAACLVVMFWATPGKRGLFSGGAEPVRAGSWFASPPTMGDTLVENPACFDRPEIRFTKPESNWIVMPSDMPGEFLVIEINRVPTRTVHLQRDF